VIATAAFVVAAALGTLARAEATRRWNRPDGLPAGTLVVNVTGSFLLGLLSQVGPPVLTVLGVAGLGAFTTFSGFAADAVALEQGCRRRLAALYVASSCVLGVLGAAAGTALATLA
jgi:fluoride exporter